jgi:hypothetical protein
MSIGDTQEIMTGLPLPLSDAWAATPKHLRSAGLKRAWQLAKRTPEFWSKYAHVYPAQTARKTKRVRLPQVVFDYVQITNSDFSVPLSHIVVALIYLALTDLSNPVYTKGVELEPDQEAAA